jgi:hypothetical protein
MSNSAGLCASCTYSAFNCISCITGYYLSGINTCLACNSSWGFCTECTSTTCLSCTVPLILSVSGCICNNTAGLYFSLDYSSCLTCTAAIINCLTCANNGSTICSCCSNGYYASNNSQICSPCGGNCLTCAITATSCTSCIVTYSMVTVSSCLCDNSAGLFYDLSTKGCTLCSSLITNCLTCTTDSSNLTQCSVCVNKYYWNSTILSCLPCSTSC